MKLLRYALLTAMISLLFCFTAGAEYVKNLETEITQPDGSILSVYATGDEFCNFLHSENGSIIIRDRETGYYRYALLRNGTIEAGAVTVTAENLHSFKGLTPGAAAEALNAISEENRAVRERLAADDGRVYGPQREPAPAAPVKGEKNAITVFVLFESDTDTFTQNYGSIWDLYNSEDKASVYSYFKYESGGTFEFSTTLLPQAEMNETIKWITLDYDRNYFYEYNSATNPIGYKTNDENNARSRELCRAVFEAVADMDIVPRDVDYDSNNDGYIDSFNMIVLGPAGDWNSPLWPHSYSSTSSKKLNGLKLYKYTLDILNPGDIPDANTAIHELSHTLGMPDLYHYYTSGDPVGGWDIMCYNYLSTPQHHTAFMREKYMGWCSISEITEPGTYTLSPVSRDLNNAYMIDLGEKSGEYFVIEYRKAEGIFDGGLPGSGLIVYRVRPSLDGNSDGPPDMLYIFRENYINDANLSADAGRTYIGRDSENPNAVELTYSDGSGSKLIIYNIGYAGDTITFDVSFTMPFTPVFSDIDRDERKISFKVPTGLRSPSVQTLSGEEWVSLPSVYSRDTITCDAPLKNGIHTYRVVSKGSETYNAVSRTCSMEIRFGMLILLEESFENGKSGWYSSNPYALWYVVSTSYNATDGSHALVMESSSSDYTVYSPAVISPGPITVTFDSFGSGNTASVLKNGATADSQIIYTELYTYDSFLFETDSGGEYALSFTVPVGSGYCYVDDLLMTTPIFPQISGTVTGTGVPYLGHTLGIDADTNAAGEISIDWYLNDEYHSTGETLDLTPDMLGKTVSAVYSDSASLGILRYEWTETVSKAPQNAPSAPTVLHRASDAAELKAVEGAEYSADGGETWQASPVFTGLAPGTGYTFICRMAETELCNASPVSEGSMMTTLPEGSGIIVIKNAEKTGATVEIWDAAEHTMVCAVYDGGRMVCLELVTVPDSGDWSEVIDFTFDKAVANPVIIVYRLATGLPVLLQEGITAT